MVVELVTYVAKDSGFYDWLEREGMVMADRGFQMHEELLLRFYSLQVPPGARAKSQMTTDECKKAKDILGFMLKGPLIESNFFEYWKGLFLWQCYIILMILL